MERLSSCYFCGAALDDTLAERPVVPSSLHPSTDTQKTVVLCGTCQRKLDAVLDTVLDAVEEATADRVEQSAGEPGDQSGTDPAGPESDLASTLGDDEEILRPLRDDDDTDRADSGTEWGGDGERTGQSEAAEGASDEESDSSDDQSKEPKYTNSRGAGFRREDDGPSGSGSLTGGAFDDDEDSDDDPTAKRASDSASDRRSGPSSDRTDEGSSSDSVDETGGSTDDVDSADDTDRSPDVTMSRLENTKVMRLLENREFPVDKDEFVTVAANAYQISRDDCEKVIDLAVEHDLLREENGQLYGGDD